jgi:hypothetical protein
VQHIATSVRYEDKAVDCDIVRDWPEESVSFTLALTWSWPARLYKHVRKVITWKTLMFCWRCIVMYPYNMNQLDALFTFNTFQSSTSTCFEQACCSSSGGTALYTQQLVYFYIHVTVHRNKFLFNNQPDALIIQIYSVIKLYMFWASSLPIIRSFLLYIRHW